MKRLCRWMTAAMIGLSSQTLSDSICYAQAPQKEEPKPAPFEKSKPTPEISSIPESILEDKTVAISLTAALRLAGDENPRIQLARQRVTEASAIRLLAVAQLLPNINLGMNYDNHQGQLQQSRGTIINVDRQAFFFGAGANAIAAGTVNIPGLNYNLNLGDVHFTRLRSIQLVAQRQAESQAAFNTTLLKVSQAYLELLRATGRKAIAIRNRQDAIEVVRKTSTFFSAGKGRKADLDRASTELRKRDMEYTDAEQAVSVSSAMLCRLLNLDPSTRLKPVEGWIIPEMIVPEPLPLSQLITTALFNRPELAGRQAEIQQAFYTLSQARLMPFSPNIIMGLSSGGFGGGSNLASSYFSGVGARTDMDIIFYWSVSNLGFGNLAQIRIARSQLSQANFRSIETLNMVRSEVAESYARTHARYAQIDTVQKALLSSIASYEEDLKRITALEGLPIELIDSLRLQVASRYELLDAIVDYNRAQVELYVSMGQPPTGVLAKAMPSNLVPAPEGAIPEGALMPVPKKDTKKP